MTTYQYYAYEILNHIFNKDFDSFDFFSGETTDVPINSIKIKSSEIHKIVGDAMEYFKDYKAKPRSPYNFYIWGGREPKGEGSWRYRDLNINLKNFIQKIFNLEIEVWVGLGKTFDYAEEWSTFKIEIQDSKIKNMSARTWQFKDYFLIKDFKSI